MFFYPILACHTTTERKVVEVPLHNSLALDIQVEPKEAQILIDGKPWSKTELPPGRYSIRVEHPGYLPLEKKIEAAPQQALSFSFSLKRVKHSITLNLSQPQSLLVHTEEGVFSFDGNTGNFPEGRIAIIAQEPAEKVLWSGDLNNDITLSRCFDIVHDDIWCVCRMKLNAAPKDVLFSGSDMWVSLFSGEEDLVVFDTSSCAMQNKIQLGGTTLLQEYGSSILALDHMKGNLNYVLKKEKTLEKIYNVSSMWNSSFLVQSSELVIASWQADQVQRWDMNTQKILQSYNILKPKDILTLDDTVYVLSSEPAQLSVMGDNVLFQKEDATFSQFLSMGEDILISDTAHGTILRYERKTGAVEPFYEVKEGKILRFAVQKPWLFIAVHLKGEKLSRGTGALHFVHTQNPKKSRIIETQNITTQLRLSIDHMMALADISTREILLLDLSPLFQQEPYNASP